MSNSRSMKTNYKPRALQTRVWWPERRLEPDSFDQYKGKLAETFATIGEPLTAGEPAGQAIVCQGRDESSQLLVVDSELRFGYDHIDEWSAAEEKFAECVKHLPIPKKQGLKLDVHLDGELLLPGIKDTGSIVDAQKLGLSEKAIAHLPGKVAFCGVSLYLCEHPVHTTVRFTPGIAKDGGIAVYVGRRDLSFASVAQLRKALVETLEFASERVARVVCDSWVERRSM